jgi:hypothetical protein
MTPYIQALAERASTETNLEELTILIDELCRALDEEYAQNENRGASTIFQEPTRATHYDEPEQAEPRLTKREKVSNCWPPPECIAQIFKRTR